MGVNNEFERKLKETKEAEKAPSALELLEKQIEEERKKTVEERPERMANLQKIANEIFIPLLEQVKKIYLDGKGEISQKFIGEHASGIAIILDWDKGEDAEGYNRGKHLIIQHSDHGETVLYPGDYSRGGLGLKIIDTDFLTKLQEQILESLKYNGNGCIWTDHPVKHSSDDNSQGSYS